MEKKKFGSKWLYWITFAIVVIIFYKLIDNLGQISEGFKNLLGILTPFGIGILIAYILYVPCKKFENLFKKAKKIKIINNKARQLSILTVYIIALLLIILVINVIMPPIVQSITDLANNMGSYYETLVNTVNDLPEDSFWKAEVITKIVDEANHIDFKQIINIEQITQYAQGALSFAGRIFDIFVAIVVSVYFLNSRSDILKFFRRFTGAIFNKKTYLNIDKYFNRSNEIFFNFLFSQILDAIVVGIITSIAMSIMGVKYAVLLGFMIGLFNLIPYIGAIIAVTIAGIITLLTGGFEQAIWMLIVVIILQQIDANIINPKIVGNSLKINPILVIFAVTVGGAYFGLIGMFLAVPIIAIMKVLIEDFIDYRERKKKEIVETEENEKFVEK
ncbi:MAG: AI-2E family transporter [Clostridia bacterium]|nr:AI-2E family transporter [Clostridia bacterium]